MKARREGFTLVEILIVVVILGILAAIVIPQFTNASETAKASNLLSQVQTIRSQMELYQVQHDGYTDLVADQWTKLTGKTTALGVIDADGKFGPYLQQAPANPFNGLTTVAAEAADNVGWVWSGNIVYGVLPSTVDADKAGLTGDPNVKIVAAAE